jgi:hypothetical protein
LLAHEPLTAAPNAGRWSLVASAGFVALVLAAAAAAGSEVLAIYLLSFWYYYLYWLAYFFCRVPLAVFRRDAVAMKTVSLLALAAAYFIHPLDLLSLAVVGLGFALSIVAAKALGADRTYYGYELVPLPPQRITRFPYSWIPHPMLLGNMIAFAGTLINGEFRAQWWPLALGHVALNLATLVMEVAVKPPRGGAHDTASTALAGRRRARALPWLLATCSLLAGTVAWWLARQSGLGLAVTVAACILAYTFLLYRCYTAPPPRTRERGNPPAEDAP